METNDTENRPKTSRFISIDRRKAVNLQWVAILVTLVAHFFYTGTKVGAAQQAIATQQERIALLDQRLYEMALQVQTLSAKLERK